MLTKFFEIIEDHNIVPLAKVYNKYCLTPLVFTFNQVAERQLPELLVTIPIDDEIPKKQINQIILLLLKEAKINLSFDLLTDDYSLWSKYLTSALQEFSKAKVPITKVAILGRNLSRFEAVLRDGLKAFSFIELYEDEMFGNDIFIVPVDIKIGTLIKRNKSVNIFGFMIFEELVKKISYHSDDQLNDWLVQAQTKPETA